MLVVLFVALEPVILNWGWLGHGSSDLCWPCHRDTGLRGLCLQAGLPVQTLLRLQTLLWLQAVLRLGTKLELQFGL